MNDITGEIKKRQNVWYKNRIKAAEKVGLTVNDDKTEYLFDSRNNKNYGLEQHTELEGHTYSRATRFKHLGSFVTQNNVVVKNIN